MEFESVRSERDAKEESPISSEGSDPGVVLYQERKRKKLEINLLSGFEIGFDHFS